MNIRDVVAEYVTLRKAGSGYKGLCPFHQEKTPSFTVHPVRQTYHCFGCGEGGDVYDFLCKIAGLTFMEAVEDVARRAGVEVPRADVSPEQRREAHLRTTLIGINEAATDAYRRALDGPGGAAARAYLERRGMPREVMEEFRLGFAPDEWEFLTGTLGRLGVDPMMAERVGLLRRGKRGGHYDLFRDRVMIPIADTRGTIVAFGGRALGDGEPKYLNSPESPIYDKSAVLYGLAQAKGAIRRADQAIIVEGYFDVLSLMAAGVRNVVATCGTALTAGQLRLLKRYSRTIVLVYDADDAGFRAACRSLDVFLDEGLWPQFLSVPDGKDPDDFVRARGGDAFRELLEGAVPLMDRFIDDVVARNRHKPGAAERTVEEVAQALNRMQPIAAAPYWTLLAERLRVDERVLQAHARGLRRGMTRRPSRQAAPRLRSMRSEVPQPEWALLMLLLHHPAEVAGAVTRGQVAEMMTSRPLADLVRTAAAENLAGREPSVARLMDRVSDERVRRLLSEVSSSEGMVPDDQVDRLLQQLMHQIHKAHVVRLLEAARRRTREAAGSDEQQRAAAEVVRLSQELAAL